MTAKWTLDTNSMQDDFFSDAAIIGIASPLPHYRFCWILNEHFQINFIREPDLDIRIKSTAGQEAFFPIYQYHLPLSGGKYLLYKLKTGDDVLLQEIKQLDYLWLIQTNNSNADAEYLINQLRDIPDVQLAQLISLDKIKNLEYLLI